MKKVEFTQKDLITMEKALQHLLNYQTVFEYDEYREEEWNNLQETIRELCAMQMDIKAKTGL